MNRVHSTVRVPCCCYCWPHLCVPLCWSRAAMLGCSFLAVVVCSSSDRPEQAQPVQMAVLAQTAAPWDALRAAHSAAAAWV